MRHRPLTPRDAEWATGMAVSIAREHLTSVAKFEADTNDEARRLQQECKTCFYLRNSVCGQAFTPYSCGLCGKEESHHNSCVPRLCRSCAVEHSLCRDCGGDLEMRTRRKNWPSPASPSDSAATGVR